MWDTPITLSTAELQLVLLRCCCGGPTLMGGGSALIRQQTWQIYKGCFLGQEAVHRGMSSKTTLPSIG